MIANLFAAQVSCLIGGVDYSKQVVTADLNYTPIGENAVGGVMPFSGTIELCLAGDYQPIDNRTDYALFADSTAVTLKVKIAENWYNLPPLRIGSANYRSRDQRATLAVGDLLHINNQNPQNADSKSANIEVGGLRSGASVRSRMLVEVGIGNIFSEYGGTVLFRYPRNFGNNYISAVSQIADSEGLVVFTNPLGRVINREVMTISATATTPVVGNFRFGGRERYEDQIAIDRNLSEFNEVAVSTPLPNKYSGTKDYYEIFSTPGTSIFDEGDTETRTTHDFSAARTTRIVEVTELGSNIYAGITGMPSGNTTSEETEIIEEYDNGQPGVIQSITETKTARVAKVAKSLLGWYASGEQEDSVNSSGAVTASPFPGANWNSNIIVSRVTTTYTYDGDRAEVPIAETVTEELAGIALFDGLTNGVPWGLIVDNSPIALGSLRTVRQKTTRWIPEGKGRYAVRITERVANAIAQTGDRSALIGGLQKAAEDEDGNLAAYWLNHAIKLVSKPPISRPASRDNAPPAPKLMTPRYTAEGASTTAELSYSYLSPFVRKDIFKDTSPPFVSDENGDASGFSAAKADLTNWLHKTARLDRMRRQSWELVSPVYPEILQNFGGWIAADIYHSEYDKIFRVILNGPGIRLNQSEAVIYSNCITLGRFEGNAIIQPFQLL